MATNESAITVSNDNIISETSIVIEPQELKYISKVKLILNKFCEIENDHILSPMFNIGLNTKWYIKVKTNHLDKDMEYLSIHLFLCYCEELSVRAKYSVSIVDVKCELKNTKVCDEMEYKISGDGWGYQKFCDKKSIIDRYSELIPNNRLTLMFDIEVIGNPNNCIEDNLLVEFKKIRCSKMLTDFKFVVSGKEFLVHKIILAARSPVFAALFTSQQQKLNPNNDRLLETKNKNFSQQNSYNSIAIDMLEISDIESNVFRELLSFIYTGKSTQVRYIAQKLLPVAEKYNIIQLKSICEDVIFSDLTEENAIKTIILAEKCNANKLRDRVIDYISDNLLLVRNGSQQQWKHFIEEYPSSVDKIFEAISYKTLRNANKKQFHINRWIWRKF